MDVSYRKYHYHSSDESCILQDGSWNPKFCPDSETCTKNCVFDGLTKNEVELDYGLHATSDGGVKLTYVN